MKKYILSFCCSVILLILFSSCSKATTGDIETTLKTNNVKPGEEVIISMKITKPISLYTFETEIHYDTNIVESIDIKNNFNSDNIISETYSVNGLYSIIFNDLESINANDEIIVVKLKLKDTITDTKSVVTIEETAYTDENFDDIYYAGEIAKIEFDIYQEPEESEPLYLSTEKYKIGENDEDTSNYQDGDKYITRVSPNTTSSEFIANLKTNGNITVYKQDGSILGDDELVGTGMTIKVTKEGNTDISLTVIVTGDVNSDGIVDITDLVKVRQQIQQLFDIDGKVTKFDEKQNKAGDINEDLFIDITDLVKIRRYIQQIDIF